MQLNVYNDFNVLSINVYIVYKLKSQINFPPAYKFAWVKEFEFDLFLDAEVAADFSEDRTYGVTLRIRFFSLRPWHRWSNGVFILDNIVDELHSYVQNLRTSE